MNPLGLFFDGVLRRIYEVPENSSFTVDGSGYRIYTPDDIPSAPETVEMTSLYIWSRYSDFYYLNNWIEKAFDRSGLAFIGVNEFGDSVYSTAYLRLINGWGFVPANYKHQWILNNNIRPNVDTGLDFDTDRITAQGVSPRMVFSDSNQIIIRDGGGGADGYTTDDRERDNDIRGLVEFVAHHNGPAS